MLCESGAAVDDMCFPEDGREILGGSSDGCHGEGLSILICGVVEVVFAFAKIDKFELVFLSNEDVGWFDIAMTDSFGLKEGAG